MSLLDGLVQDFYDARAASISWILSQKNLDATDLKIPLPEGCGLKIELSCIAIDDEPKAIWENEN